MGDAPHSNKNLYSFYCYKLFFLTLSLLAVNALTLTSDFFDHLYASFFSKKINFVRFVFLGNNEK